MYVYVYNLDRNAVVFTMHRCPLIGGRGRWRHMSARLDTWKKGFKLLRCVQCKGKPRDSQHVLWQPWCFSDRRSNCRSRSTSTETPVSPRYLLFVQHYCCFFTISRFILVPRFFGQLSLQLCCCLTVRPYCLWFTVLFAMLFWANKRWWWWFQMQEWR